jgi:signal transduction histidine kinase
MEVQDNGKSFQIDPALRTNGNERLGLLGIRERVRLVRGQFSVESAPGRGTTLRVQIPLRGAAP